MLLIIFYRFFLCYLCGLLFGFIYIVLCLDKDNWKALTSAPHSTFIFFTTGLLIHLCFSFMYSWLLFGMVSQVGNISTNAPFNILMAILCLFSSLYLFGFIQIPKVPFIERNAQASRWRQVKTARRFFLNFHFLWLSFNAVLFSMLIFFEPMGIAATFVGWFTAFLFYYLKCRIPSSSND